MEKYLEILSQEISGKIALYNSHPVADLFKKSDCYNNYWDLLKNNGHLIEEWHYSFACYWKEVQSYNFDDDCASFGSDDFCIDCEDYSVYAKSCPTCDRKF